MNRLQNVRALIALAATIAISSHAAAQNAWLSLNLEFNALGDFNSGGVWTAVAKADSAGLAGASLFLANATTFTGFLAPPELDVRVQGLFGAVRNVTVGDDLTPPYPLGIGAIGSSFPSTYVDPPGLAVLDGYADLGSFTGGVALAAGTFAPGVVPEWTTFAGGESDANVFTGPAPAPVANASTVTTVMTVRYTFAAVPEPAALGLAGLGAICVASIARSSRRRTGRQA